MAPYQAQLHALLPPGLSAVRFLKSIQCLEQLALYSRLQLFYFFIITAGRYLPLSLKYESNLKVDKKGGASLVQRLYSGSNTKQSIIQAKQLICFDSGFYYLNKKDFEEL